MSRTILKSRASVRTGQEKRLFAAYEDRLSKNRPHELASIPLSGAVAVVLNAHAKRVTPRLRRHMAALVPPRDLFYSTSVEEAQEIAGELVARGYQRVLLGGGDGTVATMLDLIAAAAAEANPTRPLPEIGILRLGTGNALAHLTLAGAVHRDVARAISGVPLPYRTVRLVQELQSGRRIPFASLGYDAQVLNDHIDLVDHQRGSFGRRMAKSLAGYLYAVLTRTIPAEFSRRPARLRVTALGQASAIDPSTDNEKALPADGVLFEGKARAVAFGTTPFYGFGIRVLPDARRRPDRFHVRVSTASIGYLMAHVSSLWNGSLRGPHMHDFLVEGVRIESSRPLPMQIAGDAEGKHREASFRLANEVFRMILGTGTPALTRRPPASTPVWLAAELPPEALEQQ